MAQPILGVMTLYLNDRKQFEEKSYFKKLILTGKKLGLHVFVFTPEDVDSKEKRINSHQLDTETGKWSRKWVSFPPVIFDRCRYQPNKRFQQLRQFRSKYSNLTYLNRPMANKWIVYKLLSKHSTTADHLPETKLYSRHEDLFQALKKRNVFFLKPMNGTGGRGILRIKNLNNGFYEIMGRDAGRRIIPAQRLSKEKLTAKLNSWKVKDRYIIQQGIDLTLKNGRVHDYRLLIQKNGKGEWEVTGCAGRMGPTRSITSNLHGGGKAVPMKQLLKHWFDSDEKIESIIQDAYALSHHVAKTLEKQFVTLCELALDIAIDRSGEIWILEVNPKPAREVFHRIGETTTYQKAIARPLEYALWVYKQKQLAKTDSARK